MTKSRTSSGTGAGAGMAVTNMGLNLLLLLFMVATNILSLYHLSSTHSSTPQPSSLPLSSSSSDEHLLLLQLHTIRATISHLQSQTPSKKTHSSPPPSELLLFSRLSPVSSACAASPSLLRQYMNYTPFSTCPVSSSSVAESLILRGCHPLPRRRCFSTSPPKPTSRSLSTSASNNYLTAKSTLDLTVPQLLKLAKLTKSSPINLALDMAGGDASLASSLRLNANTTVLTTTLNFNRPFSQLAASAGSITLHSPLQSRFPIQDSLLDLVRAGHAVNRWIPAEQLEFLVYDVDRVLRPGGLFWVDHFFCKKVDLNPVFKPVLNRLGYKVIKWAVGEKTEKEVYLTALLQKPFA